MYSTSTYSRIFLQQREGKRLTAGKKRRRRSFTVGLYFWCVCNLSADIYSVKAKHLQKNVWSRFFNSFFIAWTERTTFHLQCFHHLTRFQNGNYRDRSDTIRLYMEAWMELAKNGNTWGWNLENMFDRGRYGWYSWLFQTCLNCFIRFFCNSTLFNALSKPALEWTIISNVWKNAIQFITNIKYVR